MSKMVTLFVEAFMLSNRKYSKRVKKKIKMRNFWDTLYMYYVLYYNRFIGLYSWILFMFQGGVAGGT